MSTARSSIIQLGLLATLVACRDPSGLADRVDFDVAPLAVQTDPRLVAYRFEVSNRSAAPVWMLTCDQRVTPDIAFVVSGRTVDTMRGDLCNALGDISPISLAPGQSYSGERAVLHQAGVRYVPSLTVGSERSFDRGARLQAIAFTAP